MDTSNPSNNDVDAKNANDVKDPMVIQTHYARIPKSLWSIQHSTLPSSPHIQFKSTQSEYHLFHTQQVEPSLNLDRSDRLELGIKQDNGLNKKVSSKFSCSWLFWPYSDHFGKRRDRYDIHFCSKVIGSLNSFRLVRLLLFCLFTHFAIQCMLLILQAYSHYYEIKKDGNQFTSNEKFEGKIRLNVTDDYMSAYIHSHPVGSAAVSPCGRYLYTTSFREGPILRWDIQSGEAIEAFKPPGHVSCSLHFTGKEGDLIVGCDNLVYVVAFQNQQPPIVKHFQNSHSHAVHPMSVYQDFIITAGNKGTLIVWKISLGFRIIHILGYPPESEFARHPPKLGSVVIHKNYIFASDLHRGHVYQWSIKQFQDDKKDIHIYPIRLLAAPRTSQALVHFHLVVTDTYLYGRADTSSLLYQWDVTTGKLVKTIQDKGHIACSTGNPTMSLVSSMALYKDTMIIGYYDGTLARLSLNENTSSTHVGCHYKKSHAMTTRSRSCCMITSVYVSSSLVYSSSIDGFVKQYPI